jgi:hypothetical protein
MGVQANLALTLHLYGRTAVRPYNRGLKFEQTGCAPLRSSADSWSMLDADLYG